MLKNTVGILSSIFALAAAVSIAVAWSYSEKSSFSFAEAAYAGALWGRAATATLLLVAGCIIYATIVSREDVISVRNELRELQNRVGLVHAAVIATAPSGAHPQVGYASPSRLAQQSYGDAGQ
ncbi:hypothetical protein [Enterovirga rhinocerotis]|uniref:hypothetical protein n=1 Tax=Enterovirga rhinocerotis TaxID=1339210 RepID=UPI00105E46FF|nr:hypothetical protein [Enterovirga rhinocerotis]